MAFVLAAATLVAYAPSYENGFLNWDDDRYVTKNPHLRDGLSWRTVEWAFTGTWAANWHPLTWLSHALDVELYGLDRPWGHHLTNVLLHAANAAVLLVLLLRLTGRLWSSAAVAALFALHPLHVESVAWVAERKDLLCALFMFLSLWAYARYAAQPSARRYLVVVAAFVAALLSKPMAVTLPLVMLVLDWWPLGRLSWRAVWEKAPLVALTAASCVVTLQAQHEGGATWQLATLGPADRVVHAVYGYGLYLVKTVWPAPGHLVPLYPLAERGGHVIQWWTVAALALLLVAITAFVLQQRRRRPYLLAGWLVYLVMLVPVAGLVQVGTQVMADRYTYVPLVGVFVAVVWLVAEFAARRPATQRIAASAAVMVLALLAGLAWRQQAVWRDSLTFWSYVAEAFPRNARAQGKLGYLYGGRGDVEQAIQCYRKAVEAEPRDVPAKSNLANNLYRIGRYDDAVGYYERALELNPRYAPAHNGLGAALRKLGRLDQAVEHFRLALDLRPGNYLARVNLGEALVAAEQYEAAIEHLDVAIRQRPGAPRAHELKAAALNAVGRADEAEASLAEAERLRRRERLPDSR